MSVLARRDPVPPGLAAQLHYFQGGADVCGFGFEEFAVAVRNRPDQPYMSAPDTVNVCFYGYAATGDLRVEIRDPSGNVVVARSLRPSELDMHNAITFRRIHSDPMGVYTITVEQNGLVASTTLEVRRASSPQFIGLFDDPEGWPVDGGGMAGQPGSTVRVAVGGYQPNSTVQLHIYSNPHLIESEETVVVDYYTSHPVTVDAAGGGIWELQTQPSDLTDCYSLHSELVTRRMFPAPDAPEAPSTWWEVRFCLFDEIFS